LRIIGGKYKRRVLKYPDLPRVRPTTDFAREGLFSVLENFIDFENIEVLDLFGGTGMISFEFISRGTKNVDLIEIDSELLKLINKNCKLLNISNLNLYRQDAFKYIQKCYKQYDLIFADPPYEHSKLDELPDIILNSNILKDKGLFILEHSEKYSFKEHICFKEERRYGRVHFSFFIKK